MSLSLTYLYSSFKTFHLFCKLPKFKYVYIIISVCMTMHSLTYVQIGYVVIDLVIIWN